jgi:hypothetical protein
MEEKEFHRVLPKSELERLLAKKNFSWLTTACRKALAEAISKRKTKVTLPRAGTTEFKIDYHEGGYVYVSPSGLKFTPSAWLNIERTLND